MKQKKKMGLFPMFLLFLFIISFCLIIYIVQDEVRKEISVRDMEKEVVEEFVKEKPADDEDDQNTYTFDWDGMLKVNSDVVGWIRFDNPDRINYPIVQSKDSNQYYLKRDWQKNYQQAGSIFLNKTNNSDFTDANSVLYGHRMIAGSMFGSLKLYGNQSFMDENPYFYIYTPDGKKRTYEIFVYAQVIDGSGTYDHTFQTPKDRLQYYKDILNRAITKRDVDLDEYDTTVTLSTCASRGYYNRMVVIGKLISIEVNQQP